MSWPTALLGDVATSFVDGPFGSNLKSTEYVSAGVPVARIQNVRPNRFDDKGLVYISHLKAQQLERHDFREGDLLVTKLGEPAGVACVVPAGVSAGRIVADVTRFRGKHGLIDHRYLAYFLNSPEGRAEVAKRAKGSTRQRVNLSTLKEIPIPLAPIDEQRRIAAILDQADAVRRLRAKTLASLREMPASWLVEMIGDPILNPHGYERRQLVECCNDADDIRCGPFGTQLLREEFTNAGVPLWGIRQVNRHFEVLTEEFVSPQKAAQLSNYSLAPGDIVMTRKGTVGNCAIYPHNFAPGIMHSDLLRIRLSSQQNTDFMAEQLRTSSDVLRQLGLISGGAIMPGVNVGKLKAIKVLCPPIALQRAFADKISRLNSLAANNEAHLSHLDSLFASLQHRAFNGELTAKAVQRELAGAG